MVDRHIRAYTPSKTLIFAGFLAEIRLKLAVATSTINATRY
jgi:hypothetical protein